MFQFDLDFLKYSDIYVILYQGAKVAAFIFKGSHKRQATSNDAFFFF